MGIKHADPPHYYIEYKPTVVQQSMEPTCWSKRFMQRSMAALAVVMVIFMVLYMVATQGVTSLEYGRVPRHRFQGRYELQRHSGVQSDVRHWGYDKLMSSILVMPECHPSALVSIIITSSMDHHSQRQAIRSSWCSPSSQHQCLFLVGSADDPMQSATLKSEAQQHRDILLGGYLDTYRNLSLKVLTGLHWVTHSCPTHYILKTDDDCFVNTPVLIPFLRRQPLMAQDLYVGLVLSGHNNDVVRDSSSPWYVSYEQYAPSIYPDFASGAGYMLSVEVAKTILESSRTVEPFPNEDAYIGVLASATGITPIHSDRFTLVSSKWQVCNLRYLLLLHQVSQDQQRHMLDTADKALNKCSYDDAQERW